jgi:hypothetical protein
VPLPDRRADHEQAGELLLVELMSPVGQQCSEIRVRQWSEWAPCPRRGRGGSRTLARRSTTSDTRAWCHIGILEVTAQQSVGDLKIVEGARVPTVIRMQVPCERAEAAFDRIEVAGRVEPEDVERCAPVHPAPRPSDVGPETTALA